jgi:hypothetical protein
MVSLICSSGGVAATRAGRIKGTLLLGLAKASRTSPKGSLRNNCKVLSLTSCRLSITRISSFPWLSRYPQRFRETITSAEVTGWPSCQRRSSRKVKV